mgnify:CR=1 FL=1
MTVDDADVGRLSVAIADFLAAATPADYHALRGLLTEDTPPATLDRERAAARHARHAAPRTLHPGDEPTRVGVAPAGLPGWLLAAKVDAYTRYAAGRAATCVHDPGPSRPQPVAAAAWRSGFVSCLPCVGRHFVLHGAKKYGCDGCGRVDPDEIRAGRVVYGPMVFMFGVCRDCAGDVDMPPSPSPSDPVPGGAP